jgi:hypothetical protein
MDNGTRQLPDQQEFQYLTGRYRVNIPESIAKESAILNLLYTSQQGLPYEV